MKIVKINDSTGRTFSYPYESFSNPNSSVDFKATLEEGEDTAAATRELQMRAEDMVESHKQSMLAKLEGKYVSKWQGTKEPDSNAPF